MANTVKFRRLSNLEETEYAWRESTRNKGHIHMLEQVFRDYLKMKNQEESQEKLEPSKELYELLAIYEESEKDLKKREEYELKALQTNMKDYIEALQEREEMTNKLKSLRSKLNKDEKEAE